MSLRRTWLWVCDGCRGQQPARDEWDADLPDGWTQHDGGTVELCGDCTAERDRAVRS